MLQGARSVCRDKKPIKPFERSIFLFFLVWVKPQGMGLFFPTAISHMDTPVGFRSSQDPLGAPELIVGLVGAIGAPMEDLCNTLKTAFEKFAHRVEFIRLIELVEVFQPWSDLPQSPLDEAINKKMDAGDHFRRKLKRDDALALLGVTAIRDQRQRLTGKINHPASRTVYVLRSLKTPDEVAALRLIYGRSCFIISAFCPRDQRVLNLANRIADSGNSSSREKFIPEAEALLRRDQAELREFGQNLRETFPLSDFFVDSSDRGKLRSSLNHIVESLFGYPYHTPTKDEYVMFHAHAAALRSASLGRQVGAAIATEEGDVIALGCNEVPKGGGGMYWTGDENDSRDHVLGEDSNDKIVRQITFDVLKRLWRGKVLRDISTRVTLDDFIKRGAKLLKEKEAGVGRSTLLDVTEYGRAVHAEMAAIVDAARRGVSVARCILYTTTFPCHNCTKHIVASGIERVVFVEPYPKSRATELHSDSIVVDSVSPPPDKVHFVPFVGIAPRQYYNFFSMGDLERKHANGKTVRFSPHNRNPRLKEHPSAYLQQEAERINEFEEALNSKNLKITNRKTKR
jgi:deoxycytidylate deaminase